MDGHAAPGESLSIDGLARELGVSPTPVREALVRIEATGLVERTALKGYRVARLLTDEEVHALVDARVLLECRTAELAALRVGPSELAAIRATVRAMTLAPTGPSFADYRAYHAADHEFHRLVSEAGGNPFLASAFAVLNGQVQRFRLRRHPMEGVTDADEAVREHTEVLQALEARDARAAAAAMRRHLEEVRRRVVADRSAG
ncbi:FCD domain-containing protein [Kineococcus sp. T90]|nr:FCD domain-containing protein [Kineococcus indalonis]